MENEEFELMYNYIYKNYKKNEIKQAINSVCNYIANKQIKKYNKKMLAELLTKMAELTPYNGIVWSVRANKKNNKKIKNIMETKELNDLKQSLKKQYFDSTGRDVDKHRSSLKMFIEHIRSDVLKYIYEQLANDNDIDYFFNVDDIKTLINIYFKKIKLDYDEFNNIKHSINIFADKYSNFLPNFSTYSLYSIAEIISFNVIALLNKKYNNYKYIYIKHKKTTN